MLFLKIWFSFIGKNIETDASHPSIFLSHHTFRRVKYCALRSKIRQLWNKQSNIKSKAGAFLLCLRKQTILFRCY